MPSLKNKKIVFVVGGFDLGGAERQALNLARHLVEKEQACVSFLGFNGPGRAFDLCMEYQLPARVIGNPLAGKGFGRLVRLLRFMRILRLEHPDVVMPYTMVPNVACGLAWRMAGAKICVWNQRDAGLERQDSRLEAVAVRQTPVFISNSKHGAEFLASACGASPERILVVNNGIEMASPLKGRNAWREQLRISQGAFVSCMVANLSNFKDHMTLLNAWREVADKFTPSGQVPILLLAGRFDTMTTTLKARAFDLGLVGQVRFLDKVDDISGLLAACDLGVFSSQREGLPNGVLECMAAGLPVVGTDIPGIREALGPGQEDMLAHPGDHITLARRIIDVALDPARCKTVGEANRKRVADEFSIEKMCQATVEILEKGIS